MAENIEQLKTTDAATATATQEPAATDSANRDDMSLDDFAKLEAKHGLGSGGSQRDGDDDVDADIASDSEVDKADTDEAEAGSDKSANPDTQGNAGEPDPDDVLADPKVAKAVEALGIKPDKFFDVALAAHIRSGLMDQDRMTKQFQDDPHWFVQAGLKLAKQQRDGDSYGNKVRQGEPGDEEEAPEKAAAPPVATALSDSLMAAIGEVLDVEAFDMEQDGQFADLKEPLGIIATKVAQATLDQATGQFQKALAELEQRHQQEMGYVKADLVSAQIDTLRTRMTDKYQHLADDAAFGKVVDRYNILVSTGQYKTIAQAFEEAARWEFSNTTHQDIKNQMLDRSKMRKNGVSNPRPAGKSGAEQLTREQRERANFLKIDERHYGKRAS